MSPNAEGIATTIQREQMPAIDAYNTLKSTTSSMDDIYSHVLDYRSYWLSMSVVFNLTDIMGLSIFVSGGSK